MNVTTPEVRLERGDTDDVLGHARADFVDPGHSLFHKLIGTDSSVAPAVARLSLGLVMLPHALQKTLGWFGGPGLDGAYHMFTGRLGVPGPLAFIAIFAELLGAIGLICGVLTRFAAVAIIGVMLGAIALVHLPNGFFMNWSGQQAGEGFEYHLLAIALGLVCLLSGGGRASVDRALMRWRPANGGSVSPVLSNR